MNIYLGSTRGTVPFLQQETPAVKHLPHCTACSRSALLLRTTSLLEQIMLPELVIRVPSRDQEKLFVKVGRGLAKYRDKDQLSTFSLSLQQDELVLLK